MGLFLLCLSAIAQPERSNVATRWYELILELTANTPGYNPPIAARTFGYCGVALYEATLDYQNKSSVSLSGYLSQFSLPKSYAAEQRRSQPNLDIAANAAIAYMVLHLYDNAPVAYQQQVIALRDSFSVVLAASLPRDKTIYAHKYGEKIAAKVLDWASKDGGHLAHHTQALPPYVVTNCPSCWTGKYDPAQPSLYPMLPNWGKLRTFVSDNAKMGAMPPMVSFSTDKSALFYEQAMEVYRARSSKHTSMTSQDSIAYYWDDSAGSSFPPGHSISILTQLVKRENLNLQQAAKAYAQLGIALADAFICAWKSKYEYNLIRPISYIHQYIDSNWQPLLKTPPFPEFPSGHSVQSGSMAVVLAHVFGTNYAFTDYTRNTRRKLSPRHFASFYAAAQEAAISRLYGGIHYRDAIQCGLEQGKLVANNVLAVFKRAEQGK